LIFIIIFFILIIAADEPVSVCDPRNTGTQSYLRRLHADRYCASPILAGGRIYVMARDGTMSVVKVVKSGRNFELLAVNTLDDNFTASPAVANGRHYLRGFRWLYVIGENRER
jgi:outer membrane protein assembly factor BamB